MQREDSFARITRQPHEVDLPLRLNQESLTDPAVVAYYETKTNSIIQRYGPGPRVHYHTGLMDEPPAAGLSSLDLRQRLTAAQERLLHHAAKVWNASSNLCGEVLDVGCGLGGGAIFWAQEFDARVTAVTCVPSHVDWVARFAAQAGVASRVRALLCDALAVPGESCFDTAVAVDSSCHLARREWFAHLASLLRPGGRVFIADCFLGRREYEAPFNDYWHTRIGTMAEYSAAAVEVGLRQGPVEDISRHTEHFWTTTAALMEAEARDKNSGPTETARRDASMRAHALMRQGLADEGLHYALMSLSKDRSSRPSYSRIGITT
jgi:tocopherol O-methyltransferase